MSYTVLLVDKYSLWNNVTNECLNTLIFMTYTCRNEVNVAVLYVPLIISLILLFARIKTCSLYSKLY